MAVSPQAVLPDVDLPETGEALRPSRDLATRRDFLQRLAAWSVGAGSAATVLYTWRVEPHWLEITQRPLPIANLPPQLEGRSLALLSDLHVGPQVDDEYLLDVFRRTSALNPDIVAFAGDFITYWPNGPSPMEQLKRLFREVPLGKLGTVAILGNHDYGTRWKMHEVAGEVATIVGGSGVTMLRNQVVNVAGLQFAGLDDLWSRRFDCAGTIRQLDPRQPAIALAHNPDSADHPGWANFDGWILSGHTHGGQCKPPFLPPPMLPVRNHRYTSGAFDLEGGRNLYISRGVGHLLRVRFNVRPEVTLFRLTTG